MNASLHNLCESFIENKDKLKLVFRWDSSYIHPVCASIFVDARQIADLDKIRYCRSLLKGNTGVFSNFRGLPLPALVSLLAVDSDPDTRMSKALKLHNSLRELFRSSPFLPLVAMLFSPLIDPADYDDYSLRIRHLYNLMKKEHPFLTSGEDSIFAALLVFSDADRKALIIDAENCYMILHEKFHSGNAIQALSHILALVKGEPTEKCARVTELFDSLKLQGYKYGTEYELVTLGVIANLPLELSSIESEIIEVSGYLSEQPGYGFFGLGKKQRLMHSSILVNSHHMIDSTHNDMQVAAISSTVSLIIAQQAAMIASIAAVNAATSAAAASSH